MVETIPADVLNLIYVLIAVAGGYMVFRKFGDIIKVKIKSTTTREKRTMMIPRILTVSSIILSQMLQEFWLKFKQK